MYIPNDPASLTSDDMNQIVGGLGFNLGRLEATVNPGNYSLDVYVGNRGVSISPIRILPIIKSIPTGGGDAVSYSPPLLGD